ncbi:hypothetical protein V6N11_000323 [Hibiscus sabdariffa]|uniref:Uncharacterized protein n=1 Tax=Hibiscus sabdariffa TaxID=183260 RepID=A0ABR2NIW8_9ROSI
MSIDSLLHRFDDLSFIAEEQDVVYASSNSVVVPADDLRLSLYEGWLRATLKKKQEILAPPKGRIRFHKEDGSSNSQSDFPNLGDDLIFGDVGDTIGAPTAHANFVVVAPFRAIPELAPVSSPLVAANVVACLDEEEVEDAPEEVADGGVHVAESVLFGNEHDVFGSGVSNAAAATVNAAPDFDAIEEWLAENDDPDAPVQGGPSVKIPTKRSSSGSDPSKVKRSRSTITNSLPRICVFQRLG